MPPKPAGPKRFASLSRFFCSSVKDLARACRRSLLEVVRSSSAGRQTSSEHVRGGRRARSSIRPRRAARSPRAGPICPLTGLTYFQTISFSGVTSKIVPLAPEQMSVLPLGSRWAPEMKKRIEVRLLRRGVAPDRLVRPVRRPGLRAYCPCVVDGQHDLVDRRILAAGPAAAVVEDEHVALRREGPWGSSGRCAGGRASGPSCVPAR